MDDFEAAHITNFAAVTYHILTAGPDPFYTADPIENNARASYYGINATPMFRMDGAAGYGPGIWPRLFTNRVDLPSPVTITLTATYDSGTRSGIISATINNVSDAAVSGKLQIAITESNIYYHGSNGLDTHNFTMRDMVPDANGIAVNLGIGGSTVVNQPYTLNSAWSMSNCQIICFLQNDITKEVLQARRLFFPLDTPFLAIGGSTSTPLPGGDHDAYLDPGEGSSLVVTLTNTNPGNATGVSALLTSTDPYVTITDGSATYPDVPGFGEASNASNPFVLSISSSAPDGYRPQMSLAVTYGSTLSTVTETFTIDVGTPTDPTGPAGVYYAYEDADVGYTETPSYYGGADSAWVEIDPTKGGHGTIIANGEGITQLAPIGFPFKYYGSTTDSVAVSSDGWVDLSKSLAVDDSPSHIPNSDGPASMIAGLWDDMDPTAPGSGKIYRYYDAAHHRCIIEYSGVEHFISGLPEWFEIILLDPAYYPTLTGDGAILVVYQHMTDPTSGVAGIENSTQTVGIEYSYWGTPNPAAVGIADHRVVKYTPNVPQLRTDVAHQGTVGPALLLAASPNPTSGTTQISFRLPAAQHAAVRVYGVDGRVVATLFDGIAQSGVTRTAWDGRDASGNPVAAGLYFARLETPGGSQSGKVMLIR